MHQAEKINLLDQQYPQLKNVKNAAGLNKLKPAETEKPQSNFSLLKRFLKELQVSNDFSLRMYNREVI